MKLKWNLNQTETSLLENITNIGESNNREKKRHKTISDLRRIF